MAQRLEVVSKIKPGRKKGEYTLEWPEDFSVSTKKDLEVRAQQNFLPDAIQLVELIEDKLEKSYKPGGYVVIGIPIQKLVYVAKYVIELYEDAGWQLDYKLDIRYGYKGRWGWIRFS